MRGSRSYNLANVRTPPKEKNMAYVDGFLVPVPNKKAAKYKKRTTEGAKSAASSRTIKSLKRKRFWFGISSGRTRPGKLSSTA